jgi:hypothetical protein
MPDIPEMSSTVGIEHELEEKIITDNNIHKNLFKRYLFILFKIDAPLPLNSKVNDI